MPYLKQIKNISNFMEALLRDHKRYRPIVEFLDQIIQNTSQLSWADCEQIGLEVDKQNRSDFCTGIRAGMINALANDKNRAEPGKLEPVITFARKLNKDSSSVNESDIEAVRKAGWNDQTVEDVIGLVASLKVYSILANGLGFETLPHAAFDEMGSATVGKHGYTSLFDSFIEKI